MLCNRGWGLFHPAQLQLYTHLTTAPCFPHIPAPGNHYFLLFMSACSSDPSWDAPSVITSLHLLAQFRSATLPLLGFHKAKSPTPLLRPLLSLFLDVPCISFINTHSPKWVFLPWLTFSLHKQNSTELCDSYDIGERGWRGSRRKRPCDTNMQACN